MGTQKLLLPVRGVPMIDRVIAAASDFPTLVVTTAEMQDALCHPEAEPAEAEGPRGLAERPRAVTFIENPNLELGMAHSLVLADAAAPKENALLVFLGDKPLVTRELAAAIVQAAEAKRADVCFPEQDGVGGHPVFFSPRARERIPGLTGDSLQQLRDDPSLRRVPIPIADPGAYRDIDSPEALARLRDE